MLMRTKARKKIEREEELGFYDGPPRKLVELGLS